MLTRSVVSQGRCEPIAVSAAGADGLSQDIAGTTKDNCNTARPS